MMKWKSILSYDKSEHFGILNALLHITYISTFSILQQTLAKVMYWHSQDRGRPTQRLGVDP